LPFQRIRLLFVSAVLLASLSIAACSGGSVNLTQPAPTGTPTATPTPSATPTVYAAPAIPTSSPFVATNSEVIAPPPTAAPGQTAPPVAIALPTAAGFSGAFSLPASTVIPPNTAVELTVTNQQPADVVPLFKARGREALRRFDGGGTAVATVEFVKTEFSNEVDLATYPSFSFGLPAAFAGGPYVYYLAQSVVPFTTWQFGFEGPGVVTGTNVAFSSNLGPYTYYANTPVYTAVYAITPSAPTPTPQPVSTATIAPTPAPFTVSPSSVSLLIGGATQTLTISDPTSYAGAYAANMGNTAVATATVSGTTIVVTAVAAGTTALEVSTTDGRSLLVPITVTTSNVPVS